MHFRHRCRFGRFDKLAPLIEFVPSSDGDNLCWIIHACNTKTASRTFCCRTDFLCGGCPCGDKGFSILCRYLPMIDNLDHRVGSSHYWVRRGARFTPESDIKCDKMECPLWAKTTHKIGALAPCSDVHVPPRADIGSQRRKVVIQIVQATSSVILSACLL